MTPTRQERIGRHEIALYSDIRGNVVLAKIVWRGDVSVDEARAAADVYSPFISTCLTYVTDLSRLGKMPMEAVRILGGSSMKHPSEPRYFRLAYAVANLRTKVLMSVIIGAAALLSTDKVETSFFDTVDDAMAWARTELGL